MKKIIVLIFVLLLSILYGCNSNEAKTEEPTTPSLVTGDNLASNPNTVITEPKEETEIKNPTEVVNPTTPNNSNQSLENLLVSTIAFAETATICVQNYQTIEKTVVSGSFWRPTYETVTEHLLYGTGSGVIYYKALTTDGNYLYKVITNEHVVSVSADANTVSGEEEYKIYDENYEEAIVATLVGTDAENDIAVLEFVSDREYNAVKFTKPENIKAGRFVVAMGTPLDLEFYNTATYGIISRVKAGYIQHDAAINSGNSGGPLFDLEGNLVGINNAKLSGSTATGVSIEGIYFAILGDVVATSIKEITGLDEIVYG